MGVTVELQNLGDPPLCQEIVARIEHALSRLMRRASMPRFVAVRSQPPTFPCLADAVSNEEAAGRIARENIQDGPLDDRLPKGSL